MNAVMLSIRPQWCELIANGKKTIEVRKSRPKLKTPFKCYIYCTKGSNHLCLMQNPDGVNLIACCDWRTALPFGGSISNGKVIGEFVCDEIYFLGNISTDQWPLLTGNVHEDYKKMILDDALLSESELHTYANGKFCYGWHISALKIYDKPKELSELTRLGNDTQMPCCRVNRPPQSWCYVEELT